MATLGFVGLGIMGSGMARNLLLGGQRLVVWNRTKAKERPLITDGATAAESPAVLAAQCDVMFVCVSDTPDVEEVLFGSDGLAQGAAPGSLIIDLSTIRPSAAIEFAGRLAEEHEVHMLDAPVSGGSEGAVAGTLTIMIGGEADQVERARPFLQLIGKKITHVGGHGHGQMAKMVNQILVVGNAMAMSEALLFGRAGGLDLAKTIEAVAEGAAGSWMLSHRGPQILAGDWSPGFTVDLQQKDLRIALSEAHRLRVPALVTAMASDFYSTLQSRGQGSEGNHALVKAYENLAGIRIGG